MIARVSGRGRAPGPAVAETYDDAVPTLTLLRHRSGPVTGLTALVAFVLATLVGVGPAAADASMNPSFVEVDQTLSFTVRVTDAGVDLVSSVTASFPADFIWVGCSAPDGWACSGSDGSASWTRQSSLTPDDTFAMTLTTPAEPGESAFSLTDARTSGASSTSTTVVTVQLPPEPEPTEEPDPTEEPTEVEETPPSTNEPSRPAPPLEPFRPPAEDGPISIRDLPDEPDAEATDDAVAAPVTKGDRGDGLPMLLLAPLAILLLLSASGFVLAEANR